MKRLLLFGFFAALLTAPPTSSPLTGQAGHVWVESGFSWLVPTSDLGRTDVLGNTGFGIFDRVEQSPAISIGAGVELSARWAVRASVDRSFNADVQGEWRCVPFVACPAVLLPLEGQLKRWNVTVDALYRPVVGFFLDPFAFVGFGFRRSQLDWNEPAADVTLPAFSFEETEPVYRFGIGFERSLGIFGIFGEVEAMASRFGGGRYESIEGNVSAERSLSLDMGLTGGIRIRLR